MQRLGNPIAKGETVASTREPAKKTSAAKKTAPKKVAKSAVLSIPVGAKKAPAKKPAPAKKVPAKKRVPSAAFMKAMTPSAALAAIIGAKPMPRAEVSKKVWEYVKKNSLGDSARSTVIHLNAALKKIVGKSGTGDDPGPSITRFALMKKISDHLK